MARDRGDGPQVPRTMKFVDLSRADPGIPMDSSSQADIVAKSSPEHDLMIAANTALESGVFAAFTLEARMFQDNYARQRPQLVSRFSQYIFAADIDELREVEDKRKMVERYISNIGYGMSANEVAMTELFDDKDIMAQVSKEIGSMDGITPEEARKNIKDEVKYAIDHPKQEEAQDESEEESQEEDSEEDTMPNRPGQRNSIAKKNHSGRAQTKAKQGNIKMNPQGNKEHQEEQITNKAPARMGRQDMKRAKYVEPELPEVEEEDEDDSYDIFTAIDAGLKEVHKDFGSIELNTAETPNKARTWAKLMEMIEEMIDMNAEIMSTIDEFDEIEE